MLWKALPTLDVDGRVYKLHIFIFDLLWQNSPKKLNNKDQRLIYLTRLGTKKHNSCVSLILVRPVGVSMSWQACMLLFIERDRGTKGMREKGREGEERRGREEGREEDRKGERERERICRHTPKTIQVWLLFCLNVIFYFVNFWQFSYMYIIYCDYILLPLR